MYIRIVTYRLTATTVIIATRINEVTTAAVVIPDNDATKAKKMAKCYLRAGKIVEPSSHQNVL